MVTLNDNQTATDNSNGTSKANKSHRSKKNRIKIRYIMPSARLALREEDVVRLTLEFLHNRELNISQLSLERETGVINGQYSDDILFLRQLILDGQWDDVMEFIQPLETLQSFDMKHFRYTILRHKYIELLCIKSEAGGALTAAGQGLNSVDGAVEEVVQVLGDLEKLAPSKEEYSGLCLLLTLPRLGDHLQFRDWNPSKARIQCFREVFPLVEKFLPGDKKSNQIMAAKNDRLVQLVIKGVLYESCVNYCQAKATGSTDISSQEMSFSKLLDGSVGFNDSDLSLLSWLQSIPTETFSVPFEQKTLNVDVERLERPSLETSWTEHMLITPIKPKTFPHSVMPFTRPRSAADIMTRSLLPTLECVPYGINNVSTGSGENPQMSRSSFASFHLTGIKPSSGKLMTSSVDRLFENDGDVFLSSNYNDFQGLPSIQETTSVQSKSPEPTNIIASSSSKSGTDHSIMTGRDSPSTTTSTAKSSRRDSLSEKTIDSHNVAAYMSQNVIPLQAYDSTPKIATRERRDSLGEKPIDAHNAAAFFSQNVIPLQAYESTHKIPTRERRDSLGEKPIDAHNAAAFFSQNVIPLQAYDSTPKIITREHEHLRDKPIDSHNIAAYMSQNVIPLQAYESPPQSKPPSTEPNIVGVKKILPEAASNGGGELFEKFQRQKLNKELTTSVNNNSESVKKSDKTNNPLINLNGQEDNIRRNSASPKLATDPQLNGNNSERDDPLQQNETRPRFVAVTTLEDVQAVRCAEFHPNGKIYAVGSNSKTFRICEYPSLADIREDHVTYQPTVLFKRTKHHKGSIYCMAWSPQGDLVATGSNDKTVKLMRYNEIQKQLEGREVELTMHDGTVRDLCFIEDSTNKASLLISGGAGDCKIYVTDCATSTPFQALSGHGGHVLSLYNWGGAMFVSGSHDKTVRFWDLRTRGCVNMVTPATVPGSKQGSPVAAVCVDPSGRLLVSGHEDSSCVLYDIRGNRPIQCFKPHASDIRSIRFSPSAYYLLTGGYDNKLVLTDLQGDLTMPLPSVVVAQHSDKVISGRWHPTDFSFLSTSADKTATLWALPPI